MELDPRAYLARRQMRRMALRRAEERRTAKTRLIRAIQDYWGDDFRHATRQEKRAFAKELADMIANNVTAKGG